MEVVDMTGRVCGCFTVLSRGPNLGGNAAWRCRCECGATELVQGIRLRAQPAPKTCRACRPRRPVVTLPPGKPRKSHARRRWDQPGPGPPEHVGLLQSPGWRRRAKSPLPVSKEQARGERAADAGALFSGPIGLAPGGHAPAWQLESGPAW